MRASTHGGEEAEVSAVLLIHGNAAQIPLREKSVQCCATSPPYYGLRDYGLSPWQGGDPACPHALRLPQTVQKQIESSTLLGGFSTVGHQREGYAAQCPRCGAVRSQQALGLEPLHDCNGAFTGASCGECYVCHLVQVMREVWRVLRDDGTLWLNLGDSYTSGGRVGHGTRVGHKQQTNRGMNDDTAPPRAPQPPPRP